LSVSQAVAGLHGSAFALGTVASGLVGERLARLLGRERALWIAAGVEAGGGVALALAGNIAGTLVAALVMGLAGSVLLTLVNAGLVNGRGNASAAILTEAQVVASCGSLVTAGVIGVAASGPFTWRLVMLIPLPVVALLAFVGAHSRVSTGGKSVEGVRRDPQPQAARQRRNGPLPMQFWLRWLVVVLVVMTEFSFVFWGPSILRLQPGMSSAEASGSMGFFIGGMLAGRIAGSWLARSRSRSSSLLTFGLLLAGAGAVLAWLSHAAAVSDLALAVAGLGVGNLYPQAVDAALRAAPDQQLVASARCSLAFGLALLVGPLMLGVVGDAVGVVNGLSVIVAMAIVGVCLGLISLGPASSTYTTIRH
jgi:predicted MFS family arabinose efflux permease